MLLIAVLLAGCGRVISGQPAAPPVADVDRYLIVRYYERNNASAREGAAVQRQFLASTQHPDEDQRCDLGELTVLLEPTLSTLRPHEGWRPATSGRVPRGRVYVVAVTVTVRQGSTTLGFQIGSMHVVVLDAAVYGFAPCPT